MTLYQFKILELEQQAQATWEHGEHVATRITKQYKIPLWVIEEFYVEIYYNQADNTIKRIQSFRNPDLLAPYLDQIDIAAAFQ